jgi:hypothetical protein
MVKGADSMNMTSAGIAVGGLRLGEGDDLACFVGVLQAGRCASFSLKSQATALAFVTASQLFPSTSLPNHQDALFIGLLMRSHFLLLEFSLSFLTRIC